MIWCKVGFVISILFIVECHAVTHVKILQEPGSRTILLGPDGAVLKSRFPGGSVVTDPHAPEGILAGSAYLGSSRDVIVGGPAGKVITSYTLAGPAVVPGVLPEGGARLLGAKSVRPDWYYGY
ncbi:uncharacterized protein LOC132706455 [Cylas formicarius]|uniref:uncharacterized protein LOC132706455 n=1 Tax=Cylas formicarius TaxID=197179 RepID=UPI00295866C8|nr:uncharacterized protein LOC132706455 [Cylas formicarius]